MRRILDRVVERGSRSTWPTLGGMGGDSRNIVGSPSSSSRFGGRCVRAAATTPRATRRGRSSRSRRAGSRLEPAGPEHVVDRPREPLRLGGDHVEQLLRGARRSRDRRAGRSSRRRRSRRAACGARARRSTMKSLFSSSSVRSSVRSRNAYTVPSPKSTRETESQSSRPFTSTGDVCGLPPSCASGHPGSAAGIVRPTTACASSPVSSAARGSETDHAWAWVRKTPVPTYSSAWLACASPGRARSCVRSRSRPPRGDRAPRRRAGRHRRSSRLGADERHRADHTAARLERNHDRRREAELL